jgi:GATA-binding protein
MMKSTIKRRKRVVPAQEGEESDPRNLSPAGPGSLSPEASPRPPHSHTVGNQSDTVIKYDQPHRAYEPPAIDFTGYRSLPPTQQSSTNTSPCMHTSSSHTLLPPIHSHHAPSSISLDVSSRKRSYNVAEGTASPSTADSLNTPSDNRSARLSSISSILNPTQQQQGPLHPSEPPAHVDPALQQQQQRNQDRWRLPAMREERRGATRTGEEESRKARLKREAEEMREALRLKERELEMLDD